ncbi:MAG: endonuclease/exonuclease/phosphatase family protein [Candidatus Dormibacteria bacterium]
MGSSPVPAAPRGAPPGPPRLRVATYNVLVGGGGRWPQIQELLRAVDADVVALQETETEAPVRRLADELGYQLIFAEASSPRHQSVLVRWPLEGWSNHREAWFLRNTVEVRLVPPPGSVLDRIHLHTVHLPAAFQRRLRAEPERMRELATVRQHARRHPVVPHLVLGDFNSLAPGDRLRATAFFAQINRWRRSGVLQETGAMGPVPPGLSRWRWWQDPDALKEELPEAVRSGLPRLPWLLHPLMEVVPQGEVSDAVLGSLLPRAAIRSMLQAGYADCLRQLHPRADGFTCPTYQPAVRIDYVFADPRMARRLVRCEVIGVSGELSGLARQASDHFPLVAEFQLGSA